MIQLLNKIEYLILLACYSVVETVVLQKILYPSLINQEKSLINQEQIKVPYYSLCLFTCLFVLFVPFESLESMTGQMNMILLLNTVKSLFQRETQLNR